jgi:hypothetical protein
MNVLRNIIEGIGSVIGNGINAGGDNNLELSLLPMTSTDVRYSPQEEERLPYDTDEEANRQFVNAYWKYMTVYYAGREPRFRTDLYCAMFPVDIVGGGGEAAAAERYWWMAFNHPIARMIENNPEYESEGVWDSVYYGACVVYHSEIVEIFIDAIVDMILAQGKYLEGVGDATAATAGAAKVGEENQPMNYSDWVDGQTIAPHQSVISSLATRTEGSKKAD